MGRKVKDNPRCSKGDFFDNEMASQDGEIFVDSNGEFWDSDNITILHNGVDTIKQFYTGLVNQDLFLQVQEHYDSGSFSMLNLGGLDWKITSGRRGGYRYILKNEELGVLVLLGSFYCLPTLHGHHLKIEVSPHFILSRDSDTIQIDMDFIAKFFLFQLGHSGVSVHLCCDVQGWDCPDDLDRRLVTRAKRIYKASGASVVEFERHSIATVWGRGETFTFGSVSSLQFSVYDKSKQARDTGSFPFWLEIWKREKLVDMSDDLKYDPHKRVTRLEARFHQCVIAQFAKGMSQDFRSFYDLCDHLTGLWQYSMNNFRLDIPK